MDDPGDVRAGPAVSQPGPGALRGAVQPRGAGARQRPPLPRRPGGDPGPGRLPLHRQPRTAHATDTVAAATSGAHAGEPDAHATPPAGADLSEARTHLPPAVVP